jgi:tetratricopeptide (TPR) repeat protein
VSTSYTRVEEKLVTNDLVNIILGQFAHHGLDFYRQEESKKKDLLTQNSLDFQVRNDLAVAQLKQAKWQEAEDNFMINEKLFPKRYETAINLGILYKKQKDYTNAIYYIEESLKIKPEGHMNLGDYYLKMVEWKLIHESLNHNENLKTAISPKNFLNFNYSEDSKVLNQLVNKEYIIRLIKNDYSFSDAYVVLGDILFFEKKYQLAYRSYLRAQNLDHPYHKIISERIYNIQKIWQDQKAKNYVVSLRKGQQQVSQEFIDAEKWLQSFQQTEKRLIDQQQNATFADTFKAMAVAQIKRPKVIDAAYFKGYLTRGINPLIILSGLFIGLLLTVVILYKAVRYYIQRKEAATQRLKELL